MPRRPQLDNPEAIRADLEQLISDFGAELRGDNLRDKVLALIPAFHRLRDLGCSLLPSDDENARTAARSRILNYLLRYPLTVIRGDELMVVSGIGEWARRVRELRVQLGWRIFTGVTVRQMSSAEVLEVDGISLDRLRPDDYILVDTEQDRDAAHRWNVANEIRNRNLSVRNKSLQYLRRNVGTPVTGEELRYVAKNRTEWARRVRELRTEYGWPVATRNTGRPDLPVGVYLLESERQSPAHDRHIPDPVRGAVLRRDNYRCTECGWAHDSWNPSDPRHLEIHHIEHHARGGANVEENLTTVCTVCHDDIHRRGS